MQILKNKLFAIAIIALLATSVTATISLAEAHTPP
jgi:hypothetical protein